MWSSVAMPGPPRILMVDITQDFQGWEHAFLDRLRGSLQRSELQMEGNGPLRPKDSAELTAHLSNSKFNCMFLFGHPESEQNRPDFTLSLFWNALCRERQLPPFLFAICSCPGFDLQVSEEVLKSSPAVAPLAIAPLSPMTPREAGLFYLKFFTELKLHSADSISGKMVWFSFSKARELLRRRRYAGKFGVRC